MSKESRFREHPSTVNMLKSPKNCTTALSSYCFITLAKIELKNVRLSVSEILGVFVPTFAAVTSILFVIGNFFAINSNAVIFKAKKFF